MRSVDRTQKALNQAAQDFFMNLICLFYVPPDFGLGDFLLCMEVKSNRGFCEKFLKIIEIDMRANFISFESEDVLEMSKCYVITLACEALS